MRMNRLFAAALAATSIFILPRGLTGQESDARWVERCDDYGDRGREAFCEVRNVAVAATGSLDLESDNGVIEIAGADQQDVRLRARIRAYGETRAEAQEIARAVRIDVAGGVVRASGPDRDRDGGWQVDFLGTVPRAYGVEIDAENGPISVRHLSGNVRIEGSNGPLELEGLSGAVYAHTSNGPLTLEMSGARLAAGGIDVETSNGPLTVTLPRGIDAELEASTENGPISTNMDVPIRRRDRWSVAGEIEATLGDGGPRIRARTTNGPLTVRAD